MHKRLLDLESAVRRRSRDDGSGSRKSATSIEEISPSVRSMSPAPADSENGTLAGAKDEQKKPPYRRTLSADPPFSNIRFPEDTPSPAPSEHGSSFNFRHHIAELRKPGGSASMSLDQFRKSLVSPRRPRKSGGKPTPRIDEPGKARPMRDTLQTTVSKIFDIPSDRSFLFNPVFPQSKRPVSDLEAWRSAILEVGLLNVRKDGWGAWKLYRWVN